MNPKSLSFIVAATLFGFLATSMQSASAHPRHKRSPEQMQCFKKRHAKKIAKFDTNNDGKLDRDERHAMRAARKAKRIANHDKDGDGRLNKKERQAARQARIDTRFAKLDKDGNGEIEKSELTDNCMPIRNHFDKVDRNGDGVVSKQEFTITVKRFMRRKHLRRKHKRHRKHHDHTYAEDRDNQE